MGILEDIRGFVGYFSMTAANICSGSVTVVEPCGTKQEFLATFRFRCGSILYATASCGCLDQNEDEAWLVGPRDDEASRVAGSTRTEMSPSTQATNTVGADGATLVGYRQPVPRHAAAATHAPAQRQGA